MNRSNHARPGSLMPFGRDSILYLLGTGVNDNKKWKSGENEASRTWPSGGMRKVYSPQSPLNFCSVSQELPIDVSGVISIYNWSESRIRPYKIFKYQEGKGIVAC